MAVNDPQTTPEFHTGPEPAHRTHEENRFCTTCGEVALAFDPETEGPRCRSCGTLA